VLFLRTLVARNTLFQTRRVVIDVALTPPLYLPLPANSGGRVCPGGSRRGAFARLRISPSGSSRPPRPPLRELPAAEAKATLVAEIASEILRTRERIAELDRHLEELLADNPAVRIVRTMPGMGIVFTAEFLAEVENLRRFASADSLAAGAGVAPVLRASGATSYRRRARRGNKVLKRVLYRSAFSCISHHERREAFYRKKRAEGKGHHQAVISLARRRVDVLWAMLRNGQIYSERPSPAA
jgi:transposase